LFKFIHAADIHLDSPLQGLQAYEGMPVETIRQAPRRAFENLIKLAESQQVDFVLLAGDLYDGDWRDVSTGLFFIDQVARLRRRNIPIYLISGNHDAQSVMTHSLQLPDNCFFLRADQPETKLLSQLPVAIHGQSFANRAVPENVVENYPAAVPNRYNIGLLHTSLNGSSEHDTYAPCSLDDLKSRGYDYWALGHIHQRQVLHESPWIIFSGNIQGRNAKETGGKGCYVVSVNDTLKTDIKFHELDCMQWRVQEINLRETSSQDEALDLIAEQLLLMTQSHPEKLTAVRLRLIGSCEAHHEILGARFSFINQVRSRCLALGQGNLFVEKIEIQTRPKETVELPSNLASDALSELQGVFNDLRRQPDEALALSEHFADLWKKIPSEIPLESEFSNPALIDRYLAEAESLLLQKLVAREAAS
jgi:DNA repair protein SbcD/Mre11